MTSTPTEALAQAVHDGRTARRHPELMGDTLAELSEAGQAILAQQEADRLHSEEVAKKLEQAITALTARRDAMGMLACINEANRLVEVAREAIARLRQ